MMDERPSYEPVPDTSPASRPPAGDEARIGAWKRIVLVFTNPGEVFTDIARKPTWAVCLILTVLLSLATSLVILPHVDYEATIRLRMEHSRHKISEERMNHIVKQAGKFRYVRLAAIVVISPLAMLLIAAFYFLALKLAGSDATYLHTFSAFLHASWPAGFTKSVLSMVLIQRFAKVPAQHLQNLLKSNVAAFLPAGTPHWLHALGQTLDIFNVWTFVLLIIGMSAVGRISRKKTVIAVSALWALYIVARVALAVVLHH